MLKSAASCSCYTVVSSALDDLCLLSNEMCRNLQNSDYSFLSHRPHSNHIEYHCRKSVYSQTGGLFLSNRLSLEYKAYIIMKKNKVTQQKMFDNLALHADLFHTVTMTVKLQNNKNIKAP